MKLNQLFLTLFSCCNLLAKETSNTTAWLDEYNVTWDSQSKNSSESMPCGGGDIGLNVWVEKGDLLFYIDRSGNLDENDQQRKSGRVRIKMDPNPFPIPSENVVFEQTLDLKSGAIFIKGKSPENGIDLRLWVETQSPEIHVELNSQKESTITAAFESWRNEKQLIPKTAGNGRDYNRWASYSYTNYEGEVFSYPDTISYEENSVQFFHRNNNDDLVYDKELKLMRLDGLRDQLVHHTRNRIFGGVMMGDNLKPADITSGVYTNTPFRAWNLRSIKPAKNHHLKLVLHTGQYEKLDEWSAHLRKTIEETDSNPTDSAESSLEKSWRENTVWWSEFWNRSHVIINSGRGQEDAGWQVGRNYQLMRYMLGCNAYGEWPTLFNGGFFTFDPFFVDAKKDQDPAFYNPDFRAWGAFTAQNQRLVYWPMLKSGDFEFMRPQFDYYRKNLPNAKARNEVAWGIKGCSFSEQIGPSGLPIGSAYPWEKPFGPRSPKTEVGRAWHHPDYYSSQLEFAFMIHEWHRFTGIDISEYVPFLKDAVIFHFEYHKMLQQRRNGEDWDQNGKLVLEPGHACETYKGRNPANLVAALHKNLESLLALPDKWVSMEEKAQFSEWKERTPELSFRMRNGHKAISPVAEPDKAIKLGNREIPQLYPVFPYGIYALGMPDLDVAINTWEHGLDKAGETYLADAHGPDGYPQKEEWWGWTQQAIMLARMGLTDEAKSYVTKKLSDARGNIDFESKERMRFPTFWGPRFDWMPDINWGGSGMIALQEMLLQTIAKDGEEIRVLAAWPADWDVDFKLHAPHNTTVEGEFCDGKTMRIDVFPETRRADLILSTPKLKQARINCSE